MPLVDALRREIGVLTTFTVLTRKKTVGLAFKHEQRATAGAAISALAIHQREHFFRAVAIKIRAGDVAMVWFDFGINRLQRDLREREDRRRGLGEGGDEKERADNRFYGHCDDSTTWNIA